MTEEILITIVTLLFLTATRSVLGIRYELIESERNKLCDCDNSVCCHRNFSSKQNKMETQYSVVRPRVKK